MLKRKSGQYFAYLQQTKDRLLAETVPGIVTFLLWYVTLALGSSQFFFITQLPQTAALFEGAQSLADSLLVI